MDMLKYGDVTDLYEQIEFRVAVLRGIYRDGLRTYAGQIEKGSNSLSGRSDITCALTQVGLEKVQEVFTHDLLTNIEVRLEKLGALGCNVAAYRKDINERLKLERMQKR